MIYLCLKTVIIAASLSTRAAFEKSRTFRAITIMKTKVNRLFEMALVHPVERPSKKRPGLISHGFRFRIFEFGARAKITLRQTSRMISCKKCSGCTTFFLLIDNFVVYSKFFKVGMIKKLHFKNFWFLCKN